MAVRDNEIQRSEKLLEEGFEWEYDSISELLHKRKRKGILSRRIAGLMSRKKAGLLSERLGHGYIIDGRGRIEEECTVHWKAAWNQIRKSMQCQAQGHSISKPVVILLPKDIRQSLDHSFFGGCF